ncbi:AAA family ATPase [Corynebacterium lubricantis]|uniref:AAA family ATPase n=1 Tax=Corynebacterium lubricantis TaxID=541095 RepID=UPI00035E1DC9|nr:AAA family ATPase [Corynebacterium lubricantis]
MRIHSLSFSNVRAVDHFELADVPETGVSVIYGDNEAGKSTILDALHAVLTETHKAKNKVTRPLKPVHKDEGPEVRLRATIGPYEFEIFKRWFNKPKSELSITSPRSENFTGREADEKLAAIVAEHLDQALVDTLFMRQDELPNGIEAVGIPSMTRALDAGVEEGETGTEDTELMQRIEAEYLEYFTKSGRPVKSVTDLQSRLDAVLHDLEEKQAEATRLSSHVDEVARRSKEITQATAELPQAEADAEEKSALAEAANQATDREHTAAERATHTHAAVERVEAELQQRTVLKQRVQDATSAKEELSEQLTDAQARAEEEENTVTRLKALRDEATAKEAASRKNLKDANAILGVVRDASRLAEVNELLESLSEASAALDALRENTPERTISDEDVRIVEAAANDVVIQERLRESAAAKLVVVSPGSTPVVIDGVEQELDQGSEIDIHEGTSLAVGEFEATYRPARGSEDGSQALEKARTFLAELLAERDCASLEELRALRDEHRTHADSVAQAVSRRDAILGSRNIDDLKAEAERLRLRTEGTDVPELDVDEAQRLTDQAQEDADAAVAALARAEAELKPWAEAKAAQELQVVNARIEVAQRTEDQAEKELAAAEDDTPEADLDERLAQAQHEDAQAQEKWRAAKEELAKAQPEVAQSLLLGAQAKVANLNQRIRDAENRVAELKGYIGQAEGIAERVDILSAEAEKLQLDHDRTQRRAAAVDLLRSTMHAHRDEARRKYSAPFSEALKKYASVVFGPEVSFELDEKLQVEARTINRTTVSFDSLSGGAQEQLAVVTRFAIAELAAQGSDGQLQAPVIVDDALGSTDPARLELMNTLFTQVGKDNQVIVLTCFPQRYDMVANAARYSIEDLKQA